jgi:hypothetical protein
MGKAIVSLAACAALVSSAALAVDPQWGTLSVRLRDKIAELAAGNGYRVGSFLQQGSLGQAAKAEFRLPLGAGIANQLIGVCDQTCSNLDLQLFDAAGTEVAADTADDDTPVVNLTPPRDGTYRLVVTMAGCQSDPCGFLVQQVVK